LAQDETAFVEGGWPLAEVTMLRRQAEVSIGHGREEVSIEQWTEAAVGRGRGSGHKDKATTRPRRRWPLKDIGITGAVTIQMLVKHAEC